MNESLKASFGSQWRLVLAIGILNALIGGMIFLPVFQGDTLIFLVGVMILAGAVLAGIYTFSPANRNDRTNGVLAIVVRLVTAFLLFTNPLDRNITFTTLMAIYFGIDGALILAEAARLRRGKFECVPFMILGITSVLCSLLLWTVMAGSVYTIVSTLLSITLWIRAAILIHTAMKLKQGRSVLSTDIEVASAADAPAGLDM